MGFSSFWRQQKFVDSLCQGKVFLLKGDQPFCSDTYHVFVVLNYDPRSSELLYLVNGTSQILKSYKRLELLGVDPKSTTVCMRAGEYKFISKDTMFNCNSVHVVSLSKIDFSSDMLKDITCDQLSQTDIESLIAATLASPAVSLHIKNKIQPNITPH